MAIKRLRAKIDRIDARIVRFLNERARLAMEIGEAKRRNEAPVFAPAREEAVLRRVGELARRQGVLSPEAIRAVYSEIISACRASERRIVVAFLGPQGTFSHHAARAFRPPRRPGDASRGSVSLSHHAVRRRFGSRVELRPVSGIDAVFAEVTQRRADYGVVPIENSTEGGIGATLDMFMESDLKVCAEILVPVHHAVLSRCGPRAIRAIYSKAEVFGQCKNWLANHFPGVRLMEVASTAHAAEMAGRSRNAAAIAHEEAAQLYGLNVLYRGIEDNPFNMTRFYVIAHHGAPRSGQDKTSLLCFIKDQPGALHHILLPFWRARVNLTKIESWPSKRKAWDYCFFIDFEGHNEDRKIALVLERVRAKCSQMKVLGSFPKAH